MSKFNYLLYRKIIERPFIEPATPFTQTSHRTGTPTQTEKIEEYKNREVILKTKEISLNVPYKIILTVSENSSPKHLTGLLAEFFLKI